MEEYNDYYETFEEMYLTNYRLVYAFISDYISDFECKKDISSMVWLKVAEHLDGCMKMDKNWFKNYLRIITKTTSIDYQRKIVKDRELKDNLRDVIGSDSVEPMVFFQKEVEEQLYLDEAIGHLTDEEKMIIYMKYKKQLSSKEIACLLEQPEGTVRSKLFRTTRKLKNNIIKKMEEEYNER